MTRAVFQSTFHPLMSRQQTPQTSCPTLPHQSLSLPSPLTSRSVVHMTSSSCPTLPHQSLSLPSPLTSLPIHHILHPSPLLINGKQLLHPCSCCVPSTALPITPGMLHRCTSVSTSALAHHPPYFRLLQAALTAAWGRDSDPHFSGTDRPRPITLWQAGAVAFKVRYWARRYNDCNGIDAAQRQI
jgi:hypothetical protein